ncbi:MAG: hypothetical protein QJR11_09640 [Fulvimonas sp.]|nr:hypothetical protein [Fulvimonas sp.]
MRQREFVGMIVAWLPVLAMAQGMSPSGTGDAWQRPAPASTVTYATMPTTAPDTGAGTRFKFREPHHAELPQPPANEAQRQSGKAPVGGALIGRDGRPAVNCAATPMDPACR